jgi:outer membrane cobalamin receptor
MNLQVIHSALLRLVALTAAAGPAGAAAQSAAAGGPPVRLPAVEVVAVPVAGLAAIDGFATGTTIVGAAQLKDLAPLDFASALRRTPGVTISRYNQLGAFGGTEGGALFVRGLGSSRPGGEIKMTVDGVPKLNGVFNHPLLDLMSVDAAERIELHARAAPLAVGNTFAGFNVVTPRLEQPGRRLQAQLAAGSFGTVVERLDAGVKEGAFDTYFNQSYRRSDGHRPDSAGSMRNYFLRLGWRPRAQWEASYTLNRTRNHATDPGVAGAAPGAGTTRGEIYRTADWLQIATLAHRHAGAAGTIRVYRNDGEGDWARQAYSRNADSLNEWRLHGVRWRETLRLWDDGEIVTGADLDYNRGTSTAVPPPPAPVRVFGPETARLFSAYAGVNHTLALGSDVRLTPSVGGRFFDHDVFGRQWAPQVGLVLAGGRTQWRAGWNRALNYPGLEVAAVSSPVGNPALGLSWRALKPERQGQAELGVRHALNGQWAVAVTAFRNNSRDRYVVVPPPPPPPRYANLGAFRTEGLELALEASPREDVAVFAAASTLSTKPGDLPYAPRRTYTGGLNWSFAPGWLASVDASYVSAMHILSVARSAGNTNPNTVGAHFLLNGRVARRFVWDSHQAEVYLSGENLTDRDYAYRPGYPMPGINALVGLRFAW